MGMERGWGARSADQLRLNPFKLGARGVGGRPFEPCAGKAVTTSLWVGLLEQPGFTEPSSDKLLPDLHPQEQHVFTLVLDLNETLVYSDWKLATHQPPSAHPLALEGLSSLVFASQQKTTRLSRRTSAFSLSRPQLPSSHTCSSSASVDVDRVLSPLIEAAYYSILEAQSLSPAPLTGRDALFARLAKLDRRIAQWEARLSHMDAQFDLQLAALYMSRASMIIFLSSLPSSPSLPVLVPPPLSATTAYFSDRHSAATAPFWTAHKEKIFQYDRYIEREDR
ncbi:Mitochondrial import inner membrane translocase subunit TIM50 [Platanthera zijinensis]|uniref:Mitochondrial import inner membrane translocase subunit TIM50 n=1 Tax=Platanthera zijinensis TaxID=2320716 RepID=A0AAP0BLD2_9ASPA